MQALLIPKLIAPIAAILKAWANRNGVPGDVGRMLFNRLLARHGVSKVTLSRDDDLYLANAKGNVLALKKHDIANFLYGGDTPEIIGDEVKGMIEDEILKDEEIGKIPVAKVEAPFAKPVADLMPVHAPLPLKKSVPIQEPKSKKQNKGKRR